MGSCHEGVGVAIFSDAGCQQQRSILDHSATLRVLLKATLRASETPFRPADRGFALSEPRRELFR